MTALAIVGCIRHPRYILASCEACRAAHKVKR